MLAKVINRSSCEEYSRSIDQLEKEIDLSFERKPNDYNSKIMILRIDNIARNTKDIKITNEFRKKEWESVMKKLFG